MSSNLPMIQNTKTAANGETIARNEIGQWMDAQGHFGYSTHFGGAYVCYTCGHLCECGE